MENQYLFSITQYLANAWYRYVLLWLGTSGLICFAMEVNGKISLINMLIVTAFSLIVVLLVFINRVRTWKKSEVKIDRERVEYVRVIQDGYDVPIVLGKKRKVKTYIVIRPSSVELHGKAITLFGNVICAEEKYDSGMNKRKESNLHSFTIPPYFSNWDSALEKLNIFRGV